MIGCGYPSFFVYYEHGYSNLDLQTGGVFLYNIQLPTVYSETKVRIFNSLNSCLQNVLELSPTIDLITRFLILSILVVSSPPAPPNYYYYLTYYFTKFLFTCIKFKTKLHTKTKFPLLSHMSKRG